MKITFLGAAKGVTGSCFLCETKSTSFLVDMGLFQGSAAERMLNHAPFEFDPSRIDFLLLTHAHIDHSGRIPLLIQRGFEGRIYATKATCDLCEIMLPDSGHIQQMEAEWTNRKRERAGLTSIEPLYTVADAQRALRHFEHVHYEEILKPASDITVRYQDAGHILGSAMLEIWVKEDDEEEKIVFTGDLGKKNTAIIRDPSTIEQADWVIIESTYGNRNHEGVDQKAEKLASIIAKTFRRGGNVVIPAFAVGRTQEMIYDLNKQKANNEIFRSLLANTKTFVDSPLAINATSIFIENPDCYDEEAEEFLKVGNDPFSFAGLTFTMSAEESKTINSYEKPFVVISASGMCDAGRIKHHLKHNLYRDESSVVFVGYQAQGTLGRRIVDGHKRVRIFGETIDVHANIEKIEGFSAHADQSELLEWLSAFSRKPKKAFLIHGEMEALQTLSQLVTDQLQIACEIPAPGETYDVMPDRSVCKGISEAAKTKNEDYARLKLLDQLYEADDAISMIIRDVNDLLKTDLSKEELDLLTQKTHDIDRCIKSFKTLVKS